MVKKRRYCCISNSKSEWICAQSAFNIHSYFGLHTTLSRLRFRWIFRFPYFLPPISFSLCGVHCKWNTCMLIGCCKTSISWEVYVPGKRCSHHHPLHIISDSLLVNFLFHSLFTQPNVLWCAMVQMRMLPDTEDPKTKRRLNIGTLHEYL